VFPSSEHLKDGRGPIPSGGNHWITISTLICPPAVVGVYDSLHYQLSPLVKKTIADLLQTEKEHIHYMSTQLSRGNIRYYITVTLVSLQIASSLDCVRGAQFASGLSFMSARALSGSTPRLRPP